MATAATQRALKMAEAGFPSTTKPPGPAEDRTIPIVGAAIGVCGLLLAVPCAWLSLRFGLGVTAGAVVGLVNFLALAGLVQKMVGGAAERATSQGHRVQLALLTMAYVAKVVVLFGALYLLFRSGIVEQLGIVVGLCALVPGIVLGGLVAAPREAFEPKTPGGSSADDR